MIAGSWVTRSSRKASRRPARLIAPPPVCSRWSISRARPARTSSTSRCERLLPNCRRRSPTSSSSAFARAASISAGCASRNWPARSTAKLPGSACRPSARTIRSRRSGARTTCPPARAGRRITRNSIGSRWNRPRPMACAPPMQRDRPAIRAQRRCGRSPAPRHPCSISSSANMTSLPRSGRALASCMAPAIPISSASTPNWPSCAPAWRRNGRG